MELLDRGALKAILPIIIEGFEWSLPKELSSREHIPTTTAAKKHLRDHPSSDSIASDLNLLNGASKMVSSVTNDTDTQGEVTVAGVVNAIMRFQGVMMEENSMQQVLTLRLRGGHLKVIVCTFGLTFVCGAGDRANCGGC